MKKYLPIAALLFFVFIIYFFTKPPSILWIDSGTMIAASATLGIPNPPGFPFYMLASHIFGLLPFGSWLTRLEIFSIIFSLALLFFVYRIILTIVKEVVILGSPANRGDSRISMTRDSGQDGYQTVTRQARMTFLPQLSALFGTIALAFSYQYWSQSQNTEAFIFTYFFVTLFAYLVIRVQTSISPPRSPFGHLGGDRLTLLSGGSHDSSEVNRRLFKTFLLIAFLYGLAIGANPTVLAIAPGILYIMYLNRKFFDLKKLFTLGLISLTLAILVYSYLPIRASTYPFMNWGNPQTAELFIGHLRGAGLNIYEPEAGSINGFTGSPLVFGKAVSNFFVMLFYQFTPILLPFMILGIYYVFKKNKQLFFFLLSVPIVNVFYAGIYHSGNQESWFILSWIFFGIFIGIGFYSLVSLVEPARPRLGAYKAWPWKVVGLFLLSFAPLLVFFNFLNRSNHYYSSDYAHNLYSHLEKNAIVLGTGDFFNSLSNYVHEADKLREDVTPVTVNIFYVNKWYRDTLRNATNLSVSDKIEQIIQYRSFSEYNEAMNQFIDENIDKHPIYVSHLALRASAVVATSGGQLRLDPRFKFAQNGLTLKVVRANQNAQPNLEAFDYKFRSPLTQKPFYLERNYKDAYLNILNDYVLGFEFLADYYADREKDDLALKYYEKAYELSSSNVELLAHLGEFYARKEEFDISRQYLQKAIIFHPRNAAVRFNYGLSLANLGRLNQAKEEFEAVIALASIGDPIAAHALSVINQLGIQNTASDSAAIPPSWQAIKDSDNYFTLYAPENFKQKTNPNGAKVIYEDSPGEFALNIEIVGRKLKESENIEDYVKNSPLKMDGFLLDTQSVNVPGFNAAVQAYGTLSGDSSQLFILRRGDFVWLIKVYPGNSLRLPVFNQILNTLKPYNIL